MMNKWFLTILSTFFFANVMRGQKSNISFERIHTLNAGVNYTYFKNEVIYNEALVGNVSYVNYHFTMRGKKRQTSIGGYFASGILKNEQLCFDARKFSLDFTDGYNVYKNWNRNSALYIGYKIKTAPNYYISTSGKIKEKYTWFTNTNLSLHQSYYKKWKRQFVQFDVTLPLICLINKPDDLQSNTSVNGNDVFTALYKKSSFTSFHNYVSAEIDLSYCLNFSKAWYGSFNYNFFIEKLNGSLKIKNYNQGVKLGLAYLIK
jgi:hypothetical protein